MPTIDDYLSVTTEDAIGHDFAADLALLTARPITARSFNRALAVYQESPRLYRLGFLHSLHAPSAPVHRQTVNAIHESAVALLMEVGESRGWNTGPLYLSGAWARDYADGGLPMSFHSWNWPDCLGPHYNDLPPDQIVTLDSATALYGRLTAIDARCFDARCDHSDDFTTVTWFGTRHEFAKGRQAESIRVLWEAWEKGGHSLSQETIGERIGSSSDRFELAKVFRRKIPKGGYEPHDAWGTMIQPATKGAYRLAPPESA